MRHLIILLFASFVHAATLAQTWTPEQWQSAGTADSATYLSEVEREVIRYINLARMFPSQFAKYEVENYFGTEKYGEYLKSSKYRLSLLADLKKRKPCNSLRPNEALFKNAECLAKEQAKSGAVGHARKRCEKGNYAECCSYGMNTARDIALQLLIDHDVTSLGHRKICLDPQYRLVGCSAQPHKVHGDCAVLEFQ